MNHSSTSRVGDASGEPRAIIHRKILDAAASNPDCSQATLAEEFDVTRATISRWVNDVPGFEWHRRGEIAAEILDDEAGDEHSGGEVIDDADVETDEDDPDLAHRVVHVCMPSDRITEDEELRLLELFVTYARGKRQGSSVDSRSDH